MKADNPDVPALSWGLIQPRKDTAMHKFTQQSTNMSSYLWEETNTKADRFTP